jgi:hypothetical protein
MLRLSRQNSDHRLNTKVKEDCLRFPMIFYIPLNGRRFRHCDFWTTAVLLKLYSGQIAAAKET